MLPTTSNAIRNSDHKMSQARSSHPGKLSRLLHIFGPLWKADYGLQKPRRSIDRELQEHEPVDFFS